MKVRTKLHGALSRVSHLNVPTKPCCKHPATPLPPPHVLQCKPALTECTLLELLKLRAEMAVAALLALLAVLLLRPA